MTMVLCKTESLKLLQFRACHTALQRRVVEVVRESGSEQSTQHAFVMTSLGQVGKHTVCLLRCFTGLYRTGPAVCTGFVNVVCLLVEGFTSWQHLQSYQVGHRLVTVRTHGDFIVLPHWVGKPG